MCSKQIPPLTAAQMKINRKKAAIWPLLIASIGFVYAGNPPSISVSSLSTIYLDLSNKSASGVINDLSDPLATIGITFTITDESPGTVTLTCSSNKTSVVPNDASYLTVSGTGNTRNLKIKPKGIGYATITITAKDSENKTATYVLKYAASANVLNPADNQFCTHLSSASTAIGLETDGFLVGDDEQNEISLYARHQSGMPVATFDFTSSLKLPEPDAPEVDIEASCWSRSHPSRIYWMGSMSNSKSGDQKPNRDRIFATNTTGSGLQTQLSFVGYASLRAQVVKWGDSFGYNLTASTKTGVIPKQIDGFSLEGLEFGPDNTTLYLGFRTPYVPTSKRTKALICPVLNFETWFNDGKPSGNPSFGSPIELDLGGRGIRSISKNDNNVYVIVAGAFDGTDDFALFKWTGNATDKPIQVPTNLAGLSPEGIVEVNNTLDFQSPSSIFLVSDNGTNDWYNDDKESKDLTSPEFQKFAATMVATQGVVTDLGQETDTEIRTGLKLFPNPVTETCQLTYYSHLEGKQKFSITDVHGHEVYSHSCEVHRGWQQLLFNAGTLDPGFYILSAEGTMNPPIRLNKK